MNRRKPIAIAAGLLLALTLFATNAEARNGSGAVDKRRTTTTISVTTSTTLPVSDTDFEIVYGQRNGFDNNDIRRGIFRPQVRRAVAARTIGVTEGRLNSELRRCRTVAAVAVRYGATGAGVIAALNANMSAQISLAAARRWITQTRATALLAYVPTVTTRFVNTILYPSAACASTTTTIAPTTTTIAPTTTTIAKTTTTTGAR